MKSQNDTPSKPRSHAIASPGGQPYASPLAVVEKAWGREEILANDEFCFKRMVVRAGFQVSYHHHKVKDELFYLEQGALRLERNGQIFRLQPGQWLRIQPGDWHSFAALEDSVLLEASTHDDPSDSYRDPNRLSGPIDLKEMLP